MMKFQTKKTKKIFCNSKNRRIFATLSTRGQLRIVSWCNGSTTVFGTVCRGSNPRETTTIPIIF